MTRLHYDKFHETFGIKHQDSYLLCVNGKCFINGEVVDSKELHDLVTKLKNELESILSHLEEKFHLTIEDPLRIDLNPFCSVDTYFLSGRYDICHHDLELKISEFISKHSDDLNTLLNEITRWG